MVSGATAGSRSDYGQYEPIDPDTIVSADGKYAMDAEKTWTRRRRLNDTAKTSSGSGRSNGKLPSTSNPAPSRQHRPMPRSDAVLHRTHAGVKKRVAQPPLFRPSPTSRPSGSHQPVAPLPLQIEDSQSQTSAGASETQFQKQKARIAAMSPRSRVRYMQDLRAESARRQLGGKASPASVGRASSTDYGTSPPSPSWETSPVNLDPQVGPSHPGPSVEPPLGAKSTTRGGLMGPPPKPMKSRMSRVDESTSQSRHEPIVIDDDSDNSMQSTRKRKGYGQSKESSMQLPHDMEQRSGKKVKSFMRHVSGGGLRAAGSDGWTSMSSVSFKETKEERRRNERREMRRKETAVQHLRDAHLQNVRSSDPSQQMPAQYFGPQEAMYPPSLPGYASNPAPEPEHAPDVLPYYAPQPYWIPTAPMMAPDPPAPQKQMPLTNGNLTGFGFPAEFSNGGDPMGNAIPVEQGPLPIGGGDNANLPLDSSKVNGSHPSNQIRNVHDDNGGEITSSLEDQSRETPGLPFTAEQPLTKHVENQRPAAADALGKMPPVYYGGPRSNYVNPLETVTQEQAANDTRDWEQVRFPNGDDFNLDQLLAKPADSRLDPSTLDGTLDPAGQFSEIEEGGVYGSGDTGPQAPIYEPFDVFMNNVLTDYGIPLAPIGDNTDPKAPTGGDATDGLPQINLDEVAHPADPADPADPSHLPVATDSTPARAINPAAAAQLSTDDMHQNVSGTREEVDDNAEGLRGEIEETAARADERSGESQAWSGRDLPEDGLDYEASPTPAPDGGDGFPRLGSEWDEMFDENGMYKLNP